MDYKDSWTTPNWTTYDVWTTAVWTTPQIDYTVIGIKFGKPSDMAISVFVTNTYPC